MVNVTPSGDARVRPPVVTYACYLLYLLAALQVVSAIAGFSVIGTYRDVMKEAFAQTEVADTVATTTTIGLVGGAVLSLLFTVGYVVLGILDGKGKQPARIVTWVVLGLSLCCGGFGLIGNVAGGSFGSNSSNVKGAPSQSELQQLIKDGLPGWYQPLVMLVGVIGALAAIAAIVLLVLPASNEFFRKRQPVWEPPVPPVPGYPPVPPATPAAPAGSDQPGTSGQPATPDQPGTPPAAQEPHDPTAPPRSEP
ncbi:hypothetical protein ACNTMW_01055 [Planosporangium sp. 12N6]|uniref:hypothetical protein n=1 Tax=Planosporangium spinosum TaxID=3402278 RepID=UPI003CEB7719